jgi:hypothetical protein
MSYDDSYFNVTENRLFPIEEDDIFFNDTPFSVFYRNTIEKETTVTPNIHQRYEAINVYRSNEKKIKKKCGRIRKRKNDNKEHNKYSDDNLRRKIKHLVIKVLHDFLNNLIKTLYHDNIGKGPLKKQFQTLNQSQISNSKIDFNKQFLSKNIKEIFSEDVSSRITNYSIDYNRKLINYLLNEKDEYIKNYLDKIFSLKFIDCLNHFYGKKQIELLNGLKCYEDIKMEFLEKYEDGEDYCKSLEYYMDNFETIINNKRGRKSRKKNNNNNNENININICISD